MKLRDILKGAATIAGTLHPGIGAAIGLVNNFLPDDKKLPETATGADVEAAVATLPPEQQASLMEKEIELKIAQEEGWTERYKAMCAGDEQSTRPQIALMMAKVTCFAIILFVSAIAIELYTKGFAAMSTAAGTWTIFGTILAIPAGVLGKYFGELRREQTNRQSSVSGQPIQGLMSLFKK